MDPALRALNRFGLGARIGERNRIGSPREWLHSQLVGSVEAPPAAADFDRIGDDLIDLRAAQRAGEVGAANEIRADLRDIQNRQRAALLTLRVVTDRPFVERLVAFWSNHLCISLTGNERIGVLAGHYEHTVVRQHVLGQFADMMLASAKHPAMLMYLDNLRSIGPNSVVGRRSARRGRARGINENYARELLELHTVGVDGGYDQEDVEQLAAILTGWTVGGFGPFSEDHERAEFVFLPEVHEPRFKVVLGTRYAGEPWGDPRPSGVEEGQEAIRDLCAHPSTARFLATKLVRHFVADDPPVAAVEEIARAFLASEGDLLQVSAALIDLDDAWRPENRKFRTPQDWLIAALRSVHAPEAPEQCARFVSRLRHGVWAPAGPNGFGDTEQEWSDPDSIMKRAELGRTLARRFQFGASIDPVGLLSVVDAAPSDPLRTLLADSSIPVRDRVALAFGAPAFQWR